MFASGQNAAGMTLPDTELAREATDPVRDCSTELIYQHSRGVFWSGSLRGRNRGYGHHRTLGLAGDGGWPCVH
jgi:hypothetical protein